MIKKGNTQNTNLVSVKISPKSIKEEFLNLNLVFVDGGSQSNKPINPIRIEHGSSKKKKTVVISLSDLDLDIVNHHLLDVTKCVICRPKEESASINFLLPPREKVLHTTASLSHGSNNEKMWLALSAIEDVQRKGHSRGAGKQVIMEERKKYFSVGTQTIRAGTGIRSIHLLP